MKIYASRTAAHVALGGAAMVVAGIAASEARLVAWGAAVAMGLAVARTVTLVAVTKIRSAGFEMVWSQVGRSVALGRGQHCTIQAEIRNRDSRATRFSGLRVLASPGIDVEVETTSGEIPGGSALRVPLEVHALRVGYHGIHGLSLEVSGGPGLFLVPLTFANPFGVVVHPAPLARALLMPEGGRSGTLASAGRAGRARGDGTELRELRQHQPGDPFRRIAWKASARRGQLVVRDFEREERDIVQLVLDASVELWSGSAGHAPLDAAVDQVAALAARHLGAGDSVGVRIVGARELCRLESRTGRAQAARIGRALMDHTGVLDADRCGWDETDLLLQVAEHARPLDPAIGAELRRGDLDAAIHRASSLRVNAPFDRLAPYSRGARDRRLRRYVASFGMHVPARLQPDHPRSALALAAVLADLAALSHDRPTVVHVVAPAPSEHAVAAVHGAVRRLRARRVAVRWTLQRFSEARAPAGTVGRAQRQWQSAVESAVLARVLVTERQGEVALRALGVRIVAPLRQLRPAELAVDGAEPAPGRAELAESTT